VFRVSEIFTSIQGEGNFSGTPAHFIRFQGCPVRCYFCDSKWTWLRNDGSAVSCEWEDILQAVTRLKRKFPNVGHIVLTGGEPLWENPDIGRLLAELCRSSDFTIQIETSGMVENASLIRFLDAESVIDPAGVRITVSPKAPQVGMDEYLPVSRQLLRAAHEVKFPVAEDIDVTTRIPAFMEEYADCFIAGGRRPLIYLQPVDFGDPAVNSGLNRLAVSTAVEKGWAVSVQAHKFFGVR
jgi:7-carboxy-7-deazaguanine synthase